MIIVNHFNADCRIRRNRNLITNAQRHRNIPVVGYTDFTLIDCGLRVADKCLRRLFLDFLAAQGNGFLQAQGNGISLFAVIRRNDGSAGIGAVEINSRISMDGSRQIGSFDFSEQICADILFRHGFGHKVRFQGE